MQVNHKDANKANNDVSNLEYVTPLENTIHAVRMGRAPVGSRNGMARLTPRDVTEIRQFYTAGESQVSIAAKKGISFQHVSDIVNYKRWRSVS
jgi:hypothetical protein